MPVIRHTKKREKPIQYRLTEFSVDGVKGSTFYSSLATEFVPRVEYEKLRFRVETLEKRGAEGISSELVFPLEVLDKLPNEVRRLIEGIRLTFEHDFPDFCFMGIRKALSIGIDIRFRRDRKYAMLCDSKAEPYGLPRKIELAKQQGYLSSSLAKKLRKEAKVFGDVASHDYMIELKKEDVPSIFKLLRLALDRMYYESEKVR